MLERNKTRLGEGETQQPSIHQETCHGATAAANGLSPGLDAALETQTLQILDSSDDCIKVLDLAGNLLFMNRSGQALLAIQDITPFLNTPWADFWQESERPAAIEAIAKAAAGEVCSLQGYCPTMAGEPKWWDNKISPIRGPNGKVKRLLCISRDITEHRQIEARRNQAEQQLRESEGRYQAIVNQAATGVACTDLEGRLTLVNQKYCDITGYSADELKQRRMQDITYPEDLPRNIELFHRMLTEGTPFEIEKRYIRKDGSIVWVNNSVYVVCDRNGKPQSVVAIALDITQRKQAEAALRASEEQFRLFTAASSDTIYKMSPDWRELRLLEGKDFLASTQYPSQTWLEQYVPPEEQPRVRAAIAEAIRTKSTLELEHRVIQLDGTIGWTFSRAIPLLDAQNEIVEWLGAASNITARKQAELNAEFLAEVTQSLAEATCVEDMIQTVGEQLHRYFQISNCAFIEISEKAERAAIYHSWHQQDIPSLAGVYRLPEFVTDDFFQTGKAGQVIVVRDVAADPYIADPQRFAALKIGSFINVPLIRDSQWQFSLGVYHPAPYNWRTPEIELMCELANRIWTKLERARVEAALRESEERFRTLTATMPQLIWTAQPDGSVDYLSNQWADYVGLPPEQLYNWSWQQITHPDDLPGTVRDWQHSLQLGEPLEIQHRFRHRTGEWRWQLVRGVPIKDAAGNIRQWVGTCTDIQNEVDIKEALQESEAKYRSLFDSIDEGFCIIEVLFDEGGQACDYRFLEANPALEKHTGLVNVVGKTMRELVPQIETYWFEIYGRIVLTGVPERFENVAQEMGRFYDVYAFRMGDPNERKVAVLFTDISERKRAEQDLRESEEWARLAIQVAKLGGWRLHLDTNLVEMDQRMREIWGEPEDGAMVPLPQVIARMHPDDRERVAAAVNAAIDPQSTGIYEIEYRIVWNDGTERWVLAKGQAQFEGAGASRRTVGFFGTLLDITDRKQAEVERELLLRREQLAREEAERANRVKDEFLAVLSHELRSPLNPILGWSKLLQQSKLDEARTAQALATIERNAKLQSELIEDLLDVSRILRGKLSLTVAPVNPAATIRAAMETVRLAAEAKSIQITAHLEPEVGSIAGDSTRLQQVVWNLLSNAVKFTSPGGQVNIRLARVGSCAEITVSDTGQGIAPDFLPHVFDYFRQADGATTRKFGGLGLGLAIVRHLVELHGGTVGVASPGLGQGATFTVRVPLMSAPSKTNPDKQSPQQALNLNGINILIVDDEADTRELVAFVLEQQGAQVTAASSAQEALTMLPQAQPDVLLSDIGMPEMDGYMLIRQVRQLAPDQGGRIPAIALTAYAGDTNQQQVIAAGFQAHLSKPIDPNVLVHAIAHLIHLQPQK
jgi:PAS domain S-box-containing protein